MMKAAIMDLGLGNLLSLRRGLERAGAQVSIVQGDGEVAAGDCADAVVLPGVGSFRDGIAATDRFERTLNMVRGGEKPFLGVCLGMQMLFTSSREGGEYPGLNLIKGDVIRLPNGLKVPHMGWNRVAVLKDSALTGGLHGDEFFYFVHSYFCRPMEDVAVAETEYGVKIAAMVEKGNVFGTQFHPEKSGSAGILVLKNFLEAAKR